jgi:hypothetical protein
VDDLRNRDGGMRRWWNYNDRAVSALPTRRPTVGKQLHTQQMLDAAISMMSEENRKVTHLLAEIERLTDIGDRLVKAIENVSSEDDAENVASIMIEWDEARRG